MIVQTHFGSKGLLGCDPVQRSFDLAPVLGPPAAGLRIISAAQFDRFAGLRVFYYLIAGYIIGVF